MLCAGYNAPARTSVPLFKQGAANENSVFLLSSDTYSYLLFSVYLNMKGLSVPAYAQVDQKRRESQPELVHSSLGR